MGKVVAGEAPSGSVRVASPPAAPAPGTAPGPGRAVHRWRDLDRRGRLWALAVGAALLLAPVLAFAHFAPRWAPQGDPALMALRALDVGTRRTPLLGQPSQSGQYAESVSQVHHPGPVHFYLMALPIRLLGGTVGMLGTSIAITGTCLVGAAWATFRQLGRRAGLVAAVVLAAVAFTTGAASLVNPVSSNIAGYPLLLTAVLMWCVACGDVRLLPAATAAASFTAQQHLSVVPATAVVTLGGLALFVSAWRRDPRRRDPGARRDLARALRWSGVVALALWAPVLAQQAFGDKGNLGQMLWFARHGNRDTLGYGSALHQVAHTLGLPPLLGRTEVTGQWLAGRPSPLTWLSAAAVAAVVAVLCLRWRSARPRRARLGAMTGVVAAAGLYNGASVPVGIEQYRLAFYHWAFVLAFFVALIVGLAVTDGIARLPAARAAGARPALAALAVIAVALPPVVDTRLDRPSNDDGAAYLYLPTGIVDALAGAAEAHAGALGDRTVLLIRNEPLYVGYHAALAYDLIERGLPVAMPRSARFFVHDQRLADRSRLDSGLVLVVDDEVPSPRPPGTLIAEADLPGHGFAIADYRALVAGARAADEVVPAPATAAFLAAQDPAVRQVEMATLQWVLDDPSEALLSADVLTFLRDHPLAEPALDPDQVRAVLASLGDRAPGAPTHLRLFLLDRDEIRRFGRPDEIG